MLIDSKISSDRIILSHYQCKILLVAFQREIRKLKISLDLGISLSPVCIYKNKVIFPDNQSLEISQIKQIADNNKVCFIIKNNSPTKIQFYSDKTNKFYKLYPSGLNTAPTVEISGIRMHAVKNTDPYKSAEEMINALKPLRGNLLDTCFGLGYTSIFASRNSKVYAYEIDENMIDIAKYNPWSFSAFSNKNIHLKLMDISIGIKSIPNRFFDRIIHEPPSFKICKELYSEDFYAELYRVIKPRGMMYHYIGNPGGRYRNISVERGVIKRLRYSGFRILRMHNKGVIVGV